MGGTHVVDGTKSEGTKADLTKVETRTEGTKGEVAILPGETKREAQTGSPLNAPVVPPTSPPKTVDPKPPQGIEVASLRILRDKGILSEEEYQRALADISGSRGVVTVEKDGWTASLYGLIKSDFIYDTTSSFNENAGNQSVARPYPWPNAPPAPQSTFAGEHGRTEMSIRNSRFGLRLRGPVTGRIKALGLIELDFLGNQPAIGYTSGAETSEGAFFTNPSLRVRHAFVRIETPIVDLLFGQAWNVFGGQPFYQPATITIQGIPGSLYGRNPQARVSRTFTAGKVHVDAHLSLQRPPSRGSRYPVLQNAIRVSYDGWKGIQTSGAHTTATNPISVSLSSDIRRVTVAEFLPLPEFTQTQTMASLAAGAFIPVIPAPTSGKANALSVVGEFVYGHGAGDQYTALNSGISFPVVANTLGVNPPPRYPQDIDNGLVTYGLDGSLHVINWTSWRAGIQYYLPFLEGRFFVSSNFSRITSPNISDFTRPASTSNPNPQASYFPSASDVVRDKMYFDANAFFDVTEAVRVGIGYMNFSDRYSDGIRAVNHRFHAAALLTF